MNTVCDNLSGGLITSGSFGEGLCMRGSDLDIMNVMEFIEVHDNMTPIVFNPTKTHFSLVTEDTKQGFALLRLISCPHIRMV